MELHHAPVTFGLIVRDEAPRRALAFARMPIDSSKAFAARQIDASAKSVANQILAEQFDTVMPLLKELYRRLRPHADWTDIESDFGGKVRGSLNFTVGTVIMCSSCSAAVSAAPRASPS